MASKNNSIGDYSMSMALIAIFLCVVLIVAFLFGFVVLSDTEQDRIRRHKPRDGSKSRWE